MFCNSCSEIHFRLILLSTFYLQQDFLRYQLHRRSLWFGDQTTLNMQKLNIVLATLDAMLHIPQHLEAHVSPASTLF